MHVVCRSGGIDGVEPALVQVHEEYDVVAEAGKSMGGWHRDDEGEHVVDECCESAVGKGSPRQRRHRLEAVVNEQLRKHENKAEGVHAIGHRVDGPAVPRTVRLVGERVDGTEQA